jgi:hypothetical protein
MAVTVTDFAPTTILASGNRGLKRAKDSYSTATITGTGLKEGLDVTVLHPANSKSPNHQWNGKLKGYNDETMQGTVLLRQMVDEHDPSGRHKGDDIVNVSVTVDSSTPLLPNVTIGA